ncbi:MAG: hypothetical protein PF569_04095 [Candidatus Woesearchaeota archaeon]|jgi:hypothetical protein|nr:hypothetical protein [Candidatus Woesearchaeota archaeon]
MIKKFIFIILIFFMVSLGGVFGAVLIEYKTTDCGCSATYYVYDSSLFDTNEVEMVHAKNDVFGKGHVNIINSQSEGVTFGNVCNMRWN